eukprot:m.69135 g.69135  ORF g.69135 m.69135 type:complete len:397 (-) comp9951_c0_seq3:42-1232(-)
MASPTSVPSIDSCSTYVDWYKANEVRNNFQVAICLIGGVALLLCCYVLAAIAAFKMDKLSQRYRLLAGIFVGNCIYSLSNLFPYWYMSPNDEQVDSLVKPTRGCLGRSLWVGSQYMLAVYEFALIYASLIALRHGTAISSRHELFNHIMAMAVFLITASTFGVECMKTFQDNRSPPSDDRTSYAYRCWLVLEQDIFRRYNILLANYLRGVAALAVLIILTWAIVRRHVFTLLRYLEAYSESPKDQCTKIEIANRATLVEAQNTGAKEVAEPLTPYIAMFVAFSIPVFAMSSTSCVEKSSKYDNDHPAGCNLPCEWVLSFRSLISAFIYFYIDENKTHLVSPVVLLTMIWERAQRERVTFGGASVFLLDDGQAASSMSARTVRDPSDEGTQYAESTA